MAFDNADLECPLCGSREFTEFKSRGPVQCASCRSVPRTRITWLLLRDYAKLRNGARVAHFAPEAALAKRLHEICGRSYEPYDLDPPRYQKGLPFTTVRKCDLCTGLGKFEIGVYDAIIHNHVMEHVPCNYVMVLQKLQTLLKPGGVQVFSVPVTAGYTRSDMAPGISPAYRTKTFGQSDHLVKFGAKDHDQNLGMVFGHTTASYRLDKLISASSLRRANIPEAQWKPDGSSVFAVRKV